MNDTNIKTERTDGFGGAWWRYPPLAAALGAGVIALAGFALAHLGLITEAAENVFYWIAIPLGAWHWTHEGLEELFEEKEVGIEILMLAATAGAGILGLWDEAAALVVLYGAAEGVEEYTFARTRHAIRGLLDLAPKQARVRRDGEEVTVAAETLAPGDRLIVRPGESLATDGVIVEGRTSLDEAAVTGESVPVDKGPGDKVFAASVNGQGLITVAATAAFADNTLSKIIHLVEAAQDQKGRAQQWIERFGRRYSPAVLLGAVVLLVLPWLLGLPAEDWSRRAVVLLVAAAPCALVISLPIAMAAGIGGAGRRGILIKGGAHLEHLGTIRTVAFDKTGTLTHGRPRITDVEAFDGDEDALLTAAARVERGSEHPLARAIVAAAEARGLTPADPKGFTALTGAGARAELDGRTWYVGSPALFRERGQGLGTVERAVFESRVLALQQAGKTVVLVGDEERVHGLIALQDTLRSDAARLIGVLHGMGIRTVMLTGDNPGTAERVAGELGIDDVRAGPARGQGRGGAGAGRIRFGAHGRRRGQRRARARRRHLRRGHGRGRHRRGHRGRRYRAHGRRSGQARRGPAAGTQGTPGQPPEHHLLAHRACGADPNGRGGAHLHRPGSTGPRGQRVAGGGQRAAGGAFELRQT